MRLSDHDTNPGAYAVSVQCVRCKRMRRLADTRADLDGPSFQAYFCATAVTDCTPKTAEESEALYRAEGYRPTATGWTRS